MQCREFIVTKGKLQSQETINIGRKSDRPSEKKKKYNII